MVDTGTPTHRAKQNTEKRKLACQASEGLSLQGQESRRASLPRAPGTH